MAALITASAMIVAALISVVGSFINKNTEVPGRAPSSPVSPAVPAASIPARPMSPTPVAVPTVSTTPSKRKPRRTPEATCTWWGEGDCKGKAEVNRTGSSADCGGNGGHGGGACSVQVR